LRRVWTITSRALEPFSATAYRTTFATDSDRPSADPIQVSNEPRSAFSSSVNVS